MKRLFSILLACMLIVSFAVAATHQLSVRDVEETIADDSSSEISEDGDAPNWSEEPETSDSTNFFTIQLAVSPQNAGSKNFTSETHEAGTDLYIYTYKNTGFVFKGWQDDEGTIVSTRSSFYYTMPQRNVALTALYEYDPEVPANPDTMVINFTLTLKSKPQNGGSFNFSSANVHQGQNVHLYSYTQTGFKFNHWEDESGNVISRDYYFDYVMPGANMTLYGVFEYDPETPDNPRKNSWDQTAGLLILDDFKTGDLYSAAYEATSGYYDAVTSIIVAGRMNNNDFGIANNYSNCTMLDLSRVAGISTIPYYAFDYTNLNTIYLPSTIEKIEYGAFAWSKLSELHCYSSEPPMLENDVFYGVPEGLVVKVPAHALPLYTNDEAWNKFTLLPLDDETQTLTVELPADAADGRYKNMYIETVNVLSGQRRKYVITEKTSFQFPGLIQNTTYNVYVKNAAGAVLGVQKDVVIAKEDVTIAFASLLQPRTVAIQAMTPEGEDVTSQVAVQWKDSLGNLLGTGSSLASILEGTSVSYSVSLPQRLGLLYANPDGGMITVSASSDNVATVTLAAHPQTEISGLVKDVQTDLPLANATISVIQTLNGQYSRSTVVSTDSEGRYSATVYVAQSKVMVAATDYIAQSFEFDTLVAMAEVVALKPISGTLVSLALNYQKSELQGQEAEILPYDDYENVSYTIYNKTQAKAVEQFQVQYPQIVILDEVAAGDVLVLTAESRKQAFAPVTAEATVTEAATASVSFHIVQLGAVWASFLASENSETLGLLYDANGLLVKKQLFANAQLSFPDLADGSYFLVAMGNSSLFGSIMYMSELGNAGLTQGTDFVRTQLNVRSGIITTAQLESVPKFDEAKLYYTGSGTSFTVNKSSIVAGNYLTLRGHLDFKPAYAQQVTGVKMIVDLPAEASLVGGSIMVGSNVADYSQEGQRVIIPLDNYYDQVRFCIIPTAGGDYAPSAFAQFDINGQTITQPIGAANYSVKNLSISVPSTAYNKELSLSGAAMPKSTVTIYDNGIVIGSTSALANGSWSLKCELVNPEYLSEHSIYAIAEKDGLSVQSSVEKTVYNPLAIKVSKVTMVNLAHRTSSLSEEVSVFDFIDPKPIQAYWVWPGCYPDFTFTIEFTKNDTLLISRVLLKVHTSDGGSVTIPASYSKQKGCWIATHPFGDSYALPVTVTVLYTVNGEDLMEDATYEASINRYMGDFTIDSDTLPDGSHHNTVITEKGDSIGQFDDDIVTEDQIPAIEQGLLDEGYVPEINDPDGKIFYNDRDSSYVYLVPEDTLQQANPQRKWWRLRIWTSRTEETELIGISEEIGRTWWKHIVDYEECDHIAIIDVKGREILTRMLYKLTKTFMYKSVFERFENDDLVYKFTKILKVIWHRQKVVYQHKLYEEVVTVYYKPITCEPYPDPTPEPYPGTGPEHVLDPSGYVYEAVSSNRLQGVKATCYYKETVEDMYGDKHDEVRLWDAAEYAQENPLFTDENGMYAWDVPQGLWQVQFEKEGYVTTQSEWLPVPPPQLEVNIAMTQRTQPNVAAAHAYAGSIEVEFDKYMLPSTLTTDNVLVRDGENYVSGRVEYLNLEAVTDGATDSLVSKIRFTADAAFQNDEVTLMVSRSVESYAGIQMSETFEQTFPIELRMESIEGDSMTMIPFGGRRMVNVSVQPGAAAAGRRLLLRTTSPSIATLSADTVTLDAEGKATFAVIGELPGVAELQLAVDSFDVTGSMVLNVLDPAIVYTAAPVATAQGPDVKVGTEILLTASQENTVIYYTLDGTEPTLDNPSTLVYDGTPFAIENITDVVTIKTKAARSGGYIDSDVVTYTFQGYNLGDVNNDGLIDTDDLSLLVNSILGKELTKFRTAAADINEDKQIDTDDFSLTVNIILGR